MPTVPNNPRQKLTDALCVENRLNGTVTVIGFDLDSVNKACGRICGQGYLPTVQTHELYEHKETKERHYLHRIIMERCVDAVTA